MPEMRNWSYTEFTLRQLTCGIVGKDDELRMRNKDEDELKGQTKRRERSFMPAITIEIPWLKRFQWLKLRV